MKAEIDKLIKEKQYWKNRCAELTKQLEDARNPAPKLHDLLMNQNQLTIEDVIDEEERIECPECEGETTVWNETSRQCMTAPSECCGGCGYDSQCLTCEGEGTIEKSEE